MIARSITRSVCALAVIGLLPAGAFANSVSVQQLAMEREAVQLIHQMEEVARDVHYNSDRLDALNRTALISKWTHFHHLRQIQDLVNDGLRPALARLTELQPNLPEWKQQSIDRMLDSARRLAADTTSAILNKTETGNIPTLLNPEYKALISSVNAHAQDLVKVSDAAGNYAEAHLKATEAGLNVAHAGSKPGARQ